MTTQETASATSATADIVEAAEFQRDTDRDAAFYAAHEGDRIFSILPPIFSACVDPDAVRFDLALPFVKDGYIYATDCRIVVRVKEDDRATEAVRRCKPERFSVPNAADMFPADPVDLYHSEPVAFLPLDTAKPAWSVCRECRGWKTVNEIHHDCPECDGKGVTPNYKSVPLGPHLISAYFLEMLRYFGAFVYLPKADDSSAPFYFAIPGDNVEGLVMPMSADVATR